MEKISWSDHVRNEEVLLRLNEQRNILHEIRKRKANWIGLILRRNCLLQQVIEGKIKGQIEVTRRRWRRRKKLLDDLKDRRGYCQLKEEVLDRTMWRNCFGRGFGPVVWQITDDDDDDLEHDPEIFYWFDFCSVTLNIEKSRSSDVLVSLYNHVRCHSYCKIIGSASMPLPEKQISQKYLLLNTISSYLSYFILSLFIFCSFSVLADLFMCLYILV